MDRTGRRLWIAALAIAIPGLMFWATQGTGETPDFEIPPTQYVTQTATEVAATASPVVNADESAAADSRVEQVVGKQLGRYQLPDRSQSTAPNRSRTSSGGGFFSGLFGRSSDETKSVPTPPGELQGGNSDVNWDGVPYHDVSAKTATRTTAQPIRSQPTQSRVASRLQTRGGATASIPEPPQSGGATSGPRVYRNSNARLSVPEPPAENVATRTEPAASTSRSPSPRVVSSTPKTSGSTKFSSVTSSRRSGRAVVANATNPTESARPDYSNVPDLVPRVSRRTLAKETEPKATPRSTAEDSKKIASKPAGAKPAVSKTPIAAPPKAIEKVAKAPAKPAVAPVTEPAPQAVAKTETVATPSSTAVLSTPTAIEKPKPATNQVASQPTAPHTPASLSGSAAVAIPPAAAESKNPSSNLYPNLGYVAAGVTPPAATNVPPLPFGNDGFDSRQSGITPNYQTASSPIGSGVPSVQKPGLASGQNFGVPSGQAFAGSNAPPMNPQSTGALAPAAAGMYGQHGGPYSARGQYPHGPSHTHGPAPYYGAAYPYGAQPFGYQRSQPNVPNQDNYGPHVDHSPRSEAAGQSQFPPATMRTRGVVSANEPEHRIAENSVAENQPVDDDASRKMVASPGRGVTPSAPEMKNIAGYQPREDLRAENRSRDAEVDGLANQMRASATVDPVAPGRHSVTSELPGIRVVTFGPESMMIRQTKEYEIRVENRGAIDADGVVVRAMIPDWAELRGDSTTRGEVDKQASENGEKIVWTLDHLPAGQSEKLFVKLTAARSGNYELDVDWTLLPRKAVSRVLVHEPKLNLTIEGPDEVVYGESETYKVRVLNPGDGVAPNVVFILSPDSTPQTQRIGDIPPGKEAQFDVELTAQDLADLKIHGLATGDLDLRTEATKVIRVSAANFEAVLTGPETKYQNTEAMYGLELQNLGTATSENVIATLRLPSGCEYLGGIEGATQRGNLLNWEIAKIAPKGALNYEFRCNLTATGDQMFAFEAKGTAAGQTNVAISTAVESIADLVLSVNDPAAPAPVGSEVTYDIVIRNRGSRAARNVNVIAQFSHGIEPRQIVGQSGEVVTGQVLFDPIMQINAGAEVVLKVVAEADRAGHHRFRTEVTSGDVVLVAEEATHYMSPRSDRVSRRSGEEVVPTMMR